MPCRPGRRPSPSPEGRRPRAPASPWPGRSLRLIAQFPPGGLVDTVARLIAPHMSQALGVGVVVENRAGAGGVIGTDVAANAPADGYTSAPHLLGVMLSSEAWAPHLDHVPYAGSAPAMQDLLANNIESMVDPITTNVQQLREGSLRALAVSTPQRLPAFPNIPTFAELGYAKLTSAQWLGLSAPRNLPAPVAERLTALMPGIIGRPDIMARLTDLQTLPRNPHPTGAEFVQLMREEIEEWTAVARQFNIVVG